MNAKKDANTKQHESLSCLAVADQSLNDDALSLL